MKIAELAKKNKLVLIVIFVYMALFVTKPDMASQSFANSIYYLKEMMIVLPVIFLLTVVIEALIPKEMIMKGFGEKSGFMGNLLALFLGSISAGPVYAAFPISKTLLKKGASVQNIVIILSSWAVIKIPMLANEAKFLGVNFMALRWVLTVISIFIMASVTGLIVKKKDILLEEEVATVLEINESYCIGCSLCVKVSPDYYEMKDNKAIVKKMPVHPEEILHLKESVEKCPSNAIALQEAES